MYKANLLILLFLFISVMGGFSQSKNVLKKKRRHAINKIKLTNNLLEKSQSNRVATLHKLQLITENIKSRNELISIIEDEIFLINSDLTKLNSQINTHIYYLNDLKERYAKLVVSAYKTRDLNQKMMYIFASKDLSQAYKRYNYFNDILKALKKQSEIIDSTIIKKNKLIVKYKKDSKVLRKRKQELNDSRLQLTIEYKKKENFLISLRKHQKKLRNQLKSYRKYRDKLDNEIKRLIRKEVAVNEKRNKKIKLKNKSIKATPKVKNYSKSFARNRGRICWPTESGFISSYFGLHRDPVNRHIFNKNDGIDITTKKGAKVRAVFNGEVSQIIIIPGFNYTVILRHGSYLTVYTNLSQINVKKGQKVKRKQKIGIAGIDETNPNKTYIKFQIYNEGKKLNPSKWLARQ